MAEWEDTPGVREAIDRMRDVGAILAQPENMARAELATRGMHPVSVAHLDSAEAVELIGRLAAAPSEPGCAHKTGGNDAMTYLLPSAQAAAAFICEVTGFMLAWWTVTDTARPVYDKIDGLATTVMPGLRDPPPDLIGPGTDWERAINAWCRGRSLVEDTIGADRDPGRYQQAAVKRLGPAFRAARLGHVVQWDPPVGGKTATRQWACVRRLPGGGRCLAPVYVQETRISGTAVTRPCPGKQGPP